MHRIFVEIALFIAGMTAVLTVSSLAIYRVCAHSESALLVCMVLMPVILWAVALAYNKVFEACARSCSYFAERDHAAVARELRPAVQSAQVKTAP
jgi:hypothetical protein